MGSAWKLKAEAARFRQWAAVTYPSAERFGEWECDYPDWSRLYEAVLDFTEHTPPSSWTPEALTDVLYALARDNEIQHLAATIGERQPQILNYLAAAAIEQGERDARWQLAVELGKADALSEAVESLLLRMTNDAEEYVRRRALQELARLGSAHTEALALAAWEQPHEHQQWTRMAVLWSLHRIQSPRLETLLTEAEADPRSYLADFARRVRRGEIDG